MASQLAQSDGPQSISQIGIRSGRQDPGEVVGRVRRVGVDSEGDFVLPRGLGALALRHQGTGQQVMRLFELWIQLDGPPVVVDSLFIPALHPQSYSPTDLCLSGPGVSLQRLLQIVRRL